MERLAIAVLLLAATFGVALAIDASLESMGNIQESTDPAEVCVQLSEAVTMVMTARVVTQEITFILSAQGSNTCMDGQGNADFVQLDADLVFEAGSDRECTSLTVCADGVVEGTEFFNLILTSQDFTITDSSFGVTIIDRDNVIVSVQQPVYTVAETTTTVQVCAVYVGGVTTRAVTFNFRTQRGTATDDVDNEDFQLTGSGNLQFTQNSAINDTQCRTVSIVDDQRIEIDEDFLAIFDTQDSVVIENNMAQVIIVDNEGATLTLNSASAQVIETDSGTVNVDICITIEDSLGDVLRDIAFFLTTVADSATEANFDYVPRNGDRVTIPQGSQSACWPIVINGDEIRESDETFQVEIALEDSDDTLSASIFTVTILDDGDLLAQCLPLDPPQNGNVVVQQSNANSLNIEDSTATYSCNSGHDLSVVQTRTCGSDDIWTGSDPTCIPVDCGPPSVPQNGGVSVSQTIFLSLASYECDAGFVISMQVRTCNASALWSGPDPTCDRVDCGGLSNPANGNVVVGSTLFEATADYSCNEGHALSGASTRTCADNGVWTPAAPTCPPVDCGSLANPANGMVLHPSTTFGNSATYSCNFPFILVGERIRTCQANTIWSSTAPTCITCPSLSNPTNGSVDIAAAGVRNLIATYSCDNGHNLVRGSSMRTCQENEMWTGSEPECEIVTCPTLVDPANGTVSQPEDVFDSTATYECVQGFTLSDSTSRVCQASGMWSGSDPDCNIVTCATLSAPTNGSISFPGGLVFQQQAVYSCMEEFELEGSDTRTCEASGQWTDSAPTCEALCPVLMDPDNGEVSMEEGRREGSVANYSCDAGYTLSSTSVSSRTCQSSGAWDEEEPMCVRITVTDPVGLTPSDNTETVIAIAVSVSVGALLVIGVVGCVVLVCCLIRRKKIHKKYVLPYRAYIYANESSTETAAAAAAAAAEEEVTATPQTRKWKRESQLNDYELEANRTAAEVENGNAKNDINTHL